MDRILVTGASGLIGGALVRALAENDAAVRAAFRSAPSNVPAGAEAVIVGELGAGTDWTRALAGVSAVVHLAGPAHVKHHSAYYERTIAEGAARLARQAAESGIQRFVFMSSIRAAAASTRGAPASETDEAAPVDPYGRAKLAAEGEVLRHLGPRAIVLRPPLVCAPNSRANFGRLLRLADSPLPLPFASLHNKRSVIGLGSLVTVVRTILSKVSGAPGIFHVTDRPAVSTPAIVAALRRGLGRSANQFAVPGIGALLPASLVESLEVDDRAVRAAYGLAAGPDVCDMLAATGAAWKASR